MRTAEADISLNDGRSLGASVWRYPLSPDEQAVVIGLWRSEWEESGIDWAPWVSGAYADVMVTETAVVWSDGEAVATASVGYPARDPEVCGVMNVVTLHRFRGCGIGSRLTDLLVTRAFRAGCTSAYLGNVPTPSCTYEKCGFVRLNGVFMRRAASPTFDPESALFAPGQPTSVRPADFGDMPCLAALVAQPLDTLLLDFPRGLVSAGQLAPDRGLAQFGAVWYASRRSGGTMLVLTGATAHRVLGFGSLTPGPGSARRWLADVDFVCHGHYRKDGPALLGALVHAARWTRTIQALRLYTADVDEWKRRCAADLGFGTPEASTEALRLNGRQVGLRVQEMAL